MSWLYTDYELSELKTAVKRCFDILRCVESRSELRRDKSITLSELRRSKFFANVEPEVYFNFKCRNHDICLTKTKGGYTIYCSDRVHSPCTGCYDSTRKDFYGFFDDFDLAVSRFYDFVCLYLSKINDLSQLYLSPKDLF